MSGSNEQSSMSGSQKPWSGLGYAPVPALTNRLIARYLRGRRKYMRRFFAERGMADLVIRMDQIRASRQGMLEKNRMFQGVLDDYAKIVSPQIGAPPSTAAEAAPTQATGDGDVGVSAGQSGGAVPERDGADAEVSVSVVAAGDEDVTGPVIEE